MSLTHAYCILAHNDVYTLNKLIKCLDHFSSNIYIYIDKKNYTIAKEIKIPKYAKISILPPKELVNVYWGDISLVDAELRVLRYAYNHGKYDYFHLLSGVDLPIKSVGYINDFFDNLGPGKNLIGYVSDKLLKSAIESKCTYYLPFIKHMRDVGVKGYIYSILQQNILKLQEKFGYQRRFRVELKKGCEWASLSSEFVEYIINHRQSILRQYRGILAADEFYKQTIAWNNGFKNTLYLTDNEYDGCLRDIDWERGTPYTWTIDDFNLLISSNKLFARKFNSSVDKEIIDRITDYVTGNNEKS